MAPINTMQLPQELPRELHDDLERIAEANGNEASLYNQDNQIPQAPAGSFDSSSFQMPQSREMQPRGVVSSMEAMGEDVTVREFFGSDAAYEAATKAARETIDQSRRSAEEVRLAEEKRATLEKSQTLKLLGQRIAALRDRYAAR